MVFSSEEDSVKLEELKRGLTDAADRSALFGAYKRFLEYERSVEDAVNSPARLQNIYEETLKNFPKAVEIWLQYTNWLVEKRLPAADAYKRASEEISNSRKLPNRFWMDALKAYARDSASLNTVLETWETCKSRHATVAECADIYNAYIFYLFRYSSAEKIQMIAEACLEGIESVAKYRLDSTSIAFFMSYAYFFYKMLDDPEQARKIWHEKILQHGGGKQAELWLEYLRMDDYLGGDIAHTRKIYGMAINSVMDAPETVFQAYLQFEHFNAESRDKYDEAVRRVETQRKRRKEIAENQRARQRGAMRPQGQPSRSQTQERTQAGGRKGPTANTMPGDFQKVTESKSDSNGSQLQSQSKRRLVEVNNGEETGSNGLVDLHKRPRHHQVPDGSKDVDSDGFVRPMWPAPRTAARLGKSDPGDVHLEAEEEMDTDEQPVEVKEHEEGKSEAPKASNFAFSTGMEPNKLFVRNVHFACSEADLRRHFAKYGRVENVRIVKHKDNKPKGVAYVEFANDAEAQKGLRADGTKLRNRKILVFISNPPWKSGPDTDLKRDRSPAVIDADKPDNASPKSKFKTTSAPSVTVRVPRAGGLLLPRAISGKKPAELTSK